MKAETVDRRGPALRYIFEIYSDPKIGQIYNWRVQVENRTRHERVEAIQAENPQTTSEQAKRIQEMEEELGDYRQKVADQSMMIDLLKNFSRTRHT